MPWSETTPMRERGDRNGVNRVFPVFYRLTTFPSKDENVVGPTTERDD
jgi:hypothetical protein